MNAVAGRNPWIGVERAIVFLVAASSIACRRIRISAGGAREQKKRPRSNLQGSAAGGNSD